MVRTPGLSSGYAGFGCFCNDSLPTLFDAIHTMHERGVRRLPVLDDAGGLAGIVAADDIYAAIGKQLHDLGYALARGQVREMRLRNP